MKIEEMTLDDIETRKAAILTEMDAEGADLDALTEEVRSLKAREEAIKAENAQRAEIRKAVANHEKGETIMPVVETTEKNAVEVRAAHFAETGHTEIETRALLSTGTLRPVKTKEEIGELPEVMSSIVDDVYAFDATGTGSYSFSYEDTDAAAAAVTEGAAISSTSATFAHDTITPEDVGTLDTISRNVKKRTPINYEAAVRRRAYLALRREMKKMIVTKVLADARTEAKTYALDQNFVRELVLGFNADESVAGGTKLYLCKADLQTLGKIRGTNEKKAVFDIEFTDENNGTIKDGGMVVNFSICSDLAGTGASSGNQMIYGQPQAIEMPMWDNYEIETDEGGKYFEANLMAIRGLQSASCAVTRKNAIQVIN